MNKEEVTERRLMQEARDNQIATINKGGLDCARVEVSYGTESENWPMEPDEEHCGYFIVVCHEPEVWNEEEAGEPYSPYASSEALIGEWFEDHQGFCDWWKIDATYAC